MDRTVFHVTTSTSFASIRSQGLIPAIGPRAAAAKESEPAIYCFSNRAALEDGMTGWLADAFEDEGAGSEAWIVLELALPQGVSVRHEVPWETIVTTPLSFDVVRCVMNEALEPSEPPDSTRSRSDPRRGP